MKVALTYRVLQHYRVPAFRRLANWPGVDFYAFHGKDIKGTKVVNGNNLTGFAHKQLFTLNPVTARQKELVPMPFCPTLPLHLAIFRPDVILAEGGSNLINNFLIIAYAGLTRTPIVWWSLGVLPEELRGQKKRSIIQRIFRSLTAWQERRCSVFLGYSSVAIQYFDHMGYAKERQFRSTNCVDTDAVFERIENARPRVEDLRKLYGLEGKTVLLYVGAIAKTKRLEDLLDVYKRLCGRYSDLILMIVGDGEHRPALESYVRQCGAEDVIFTGQVIEDVSSYFLLADIFVLPGLGGLAISEAMCHGLPVIAAEADGCEVDLIEEGKNGYLINTGDQARMEACLESMLKDPEKRRRMGAYSRWIIENRYNINTYMGNMVAALDCAYSISRRHRGYASSVNADR